MAGRYANLPPPTRDSLELASLASSSHPSRRTSEDSSVSGAPSSRRLSLDDEDPLFEASEHEGNRPRHNRSYSVSSAFDFAPNLFPLSSTAQGYTALGAPSNPTLDSTNALNGGSLEKNKSLTYLNGLSLVIGLIIGSGIFSSPSQVNKNAGSPGASLIIWVVAGVLAWTGAASYAELGGAIPLNGGAQVYLSKIFGEWAGFLFTWCAVTVLKPGSAAIIAIIFGEYLVRAVIGAEAVDASAWLNKGIALAGLVVVTAMNCVSTKLGTRSADVFMFLKFVALLGVFVIGIVVAITGLSYRGDANQDWKKQGWFDNTSHNISNWAVALYAGLWAFDGWDNVHPLSAHPQTSTNKPPGQLRNRRVQKPFPRPPPRNPHLPPPRNPLLHPRQHILLPRAAHAHHRVLQHRRRGLRQPSLRPHWRAHSRPLRLGILLRRTQCNNLYIRAPGLCSRQRRLPAIPLRNDWTGQSAPGYSVELCKHREQQGSTENGDVVRRPGCGILFHAHLRDATQRRTHIRLRSDRQLRHARHILRRRGVHILLPDRAGPHHPTRTGTGSRAPIQDMDHDTHYILLRELVSAEPGGIRRARADTSCSRVHGSRTSNLVRMGRAEEREREAKIQKHGGRRRREARQLDVLEEVDRLILAQCDNDSRNETMNK